MDQSADDNTRTIATDGNDTIAKDLSPCEDDENDDFLPNPWEEPCGFVLHLFALLSAIVYSIYLLHVYGALTQSDASLRDGTVSIPAWTWIFPWSLVILFFVIPMIYGLLNAAIVVAPHTGGLSILQDSYTMVPPGPSPLQRIRFHPRPQNSSDPAFQECVQLFCRRPIEWKEQQSPIGASTKDSLEHFDGADHSTNRSISAIGDIDVADINDWVSWNATATVRRTTS
jgi:hypothetical protein